MQPYFSAPGMTLYLGDCREVVPALGLRDVALTLTDPPYEETKLEWDRHVAGWIDVVPSDSLWCFGSLSMFMARAKDFLDSPWTRSQEIVWEKHNGSNSAADRFRRVHELAVHFYRGAWSDVFHQPVFTMDAVARQSRRKKRPQHWGSIGEHTYVSEDGGPRMQRSVIYARSAHGYAIHPTQKSSGILEPLLRYACPPGGLVVDPFAGSGSTLLTASRLGMFAVGVELDEAQAEKSARWLEAESKQPSLFLPGAS